MEVILLIVVVGIFGIAYLIEKVTDLVKQLKPGRSKKLLGPGRTLKFTTSLSLDDKNKEACATQRKPHDTDRLGH